MGIRDASVSAEKLLHNCTESPLRWRSSFMDGAIRSAGIPLSFGETNGEISSIWQRAKSLSSISHTISFVP